MQEIVFADDGIKVVRSVQQEVVFLGTAGLQGAPGKGVAKGGNTGDILTKLSEDDYDTAWTPPSDLADKTYTQDFTVASSVTVTHNLGKYPAVTVIDSAGDEVEGDVDHASLNELTVSFSAPFSGKVISNLEHQCMARKLYTPIDLTKNEMLHAVVQVLPSDPGSPVEGQVYYNSTSKKLRQYNGTGWNEYNTGSGVTNLAATRSTTQVVVTSDTGTDATIPAADTTNAGVMTAADKTKLNGIEAGADVTDATNVDAAGAVMNSDTSTAGMGFVVDEDDMVSDSATKVPTQQSVRAYVLARVAALVDTAPGTLDTLNELAAALGDDPNFATTLSTQISGLDTRLDTLEANGGPTKKYAATIGGATSIVITHNLGSRDVTVEVYDAATYETVECDVTRNSTSQVTLGFAVAPAASSLRAVVVG